MWYAICLGIGLAIGVGFLIWALRERAKRGDAEKGMDAALAQVTRLEEHIKKEQIIAANLQAELARENARVTVLRRALEEAQQRLLSCNDPKAVREWLEAELKTQI